MSDIEKRLRKQIAEQEAVIHRLQNSMSKAAEGFSELLQSARSSAQQEVEFWQRAMTVQSVKLQAALRAGGPEVREAVRSVIRSAGDKAAFDHPDRLHFRAVAVAEREACAQLAEAMPKMRQISPGHVAAVAPQDVAAAIRERGNG